MSELQIIGVPQSNFVWTTRIFVAEKGVPYTALPGQPHGPDSAAIHPFGKVPVMRHGDFTLAESRAICAYVDRSFDGPILTPSDARLAAKVEQWASIVQTTVEPLLIRQYLFAYMFPGTQDGQPDRVRVQSLVPQVKMQLDRLEDAARSGEIANDRFTIVDAYLIPILFYLRTLPEHPDTLGSRRLLSAYLDRHLDRESVRGTVPPPPN
jgi:glutathione S-transferase